MSVSYDNPQLQHTRNWKTRKAPLPKQDRVSMSWVYNAAPAVRMCKHGAA